MKHFREWYSSIFQSTNSQKAIKILDVGGTPDYWRYIGLRFIGNVQITSLNLEASDVPKDFNGIITSVKGNATNMKEFYDKAFDLVFSNSVIEHVGDFNCQKMMASELLRLAPHGYLQTPNKYFFMEPHFLFPFFLLLPRAIREYLVYKFQLGYFSVSVKV